MLGQSYSDQIKDYITGRLPFAGNSEIATEVMAQFNPGRSHNGVRQLVLSMRAIEFPAASTLADECEKSGVDVGDVSSYWLKSKSISIQVKPGKKSYFEVRDQVIEEMDKHSPTYPNIGNTSWEQTDCNLLVLSPADAHIGKLCSVTETGERYDVGIAASRIKEGVLRTLEKASVFGIEQILFVVGNDILHTDNAVRTTTSGTPQDTDGMWYDNFHVAKGVYIDAIESCMALAPVHVHFNPSNHDYMTGFFLADTLKSWFRKSDRVVFDVDISHRKYFRYGNNLIGTTHGDGAKEGDLALLMAHEAAQYWGDCPKRYIYKHHLHHKTAKDYMSVCLETLRSPSSTDSWHHRNGYQHAPKAIEGFIHHPIHGQVAKLTHYF